jgi:hypothetical protein
MWVYRFDPETNKKLAQKWRLWSEFFSELCIMNMFPQGQTENEMKNKVVEYWLIKKCMQLLKLYSLLNIVRGG